MWLVNAKNQIGRITHMTAQWHRNGNDAWRRKIPADAPPLTAAEQKFIPDLDKHVNWRLFNDMSGGLMTELGTHQLDVASWFMGSIPTKVSGMGGIDYWRDNRDAEDNIAMVYEWRVKRGDLGFGELTYRRNPKQSRGKLNAPYKVRMTYSSICMNSKRHYSELIQGDRGAIELIGEQRCQFYAEPTYMERLKQEAERKKAQAAGKGVAPTEDEKTKESYIPGEAINNGVRLDVYTDEKGGTEYDVWMANHLQWEAFANHIKHGGVPRSNQMAGLVSSICGHKGNEALRTGNTIEIDPALMAFDFETPDPFTYDSDVKGPNLAESLKKMQEEEEAKKKAAEAAKETA
jgi:predicted dehydrogenase